MRIMRCHDTGSLATAGTLLTTRGVRTMPAPLSRILHLTNSEFINHLNRIRSHSNSIYKLGYFLFSSIDQSRKVVNSLDFGVIFSMIGAFLVCMSLSVAYGTSSISGTLILLNAHYLFDLL